VNESPVLDVILDFVWLGILGAIVTVPILIIRARTGRRRGL
jgi:hypothetical protein